MAHLFYAPPLERGQCLVIGHLPPLYDVLLEVRVPEEVVWAYLVPDEEELALERKGDVVRVMVPEVKCHQAVVFQYQP